METSPEINELATALALAQSEFPTVDRTETARVKSDKAEYSYRYASLASVLEAIRAPLAKNGLSIIQTPHTGEQGRLSVTLLLMHKSGQFFKDTFSMPVAQQTPQGIGTIISYARRYQLQACLGLATDDDDAQDAHDAGPYSGGRTSGGRSGQGKPQTNPQNDLLPATETQVEAINKICNANEWDAATTAQTWFSVGVTELTGQQAKEMISKLSKLASDAARVTKS